MKKTSCKGPMYKYLGHFAQQKWLDKGHNDVCETNSKGHRICVPDVEDAKQRRSEMDSEKSKMEGMNQDDQDRAMEGIYNFHADIQKAKQSGLSQEEAEIKVNDDYDREDPQR